MRFSRIQCYLLLIFLLFSVDSVYGHTINYNLEQAPTSDVVSYYLLLGYKHILPDGFDHILFIVGLCLLTPNLKSIVWQATAFTVAHSITLALTMKNIIIVPSEIIEPIIALSILFVAIENILIKDLKPWRIALVFAFGLVHGMGFASSLNEIGLPRDAFYTSIIAFNIGVEIGQLSVILISFGTILYWFRNKLWYRKYVVYPLSIAIGVVALYWFIERI